MWTFFCTLKLINWELFSQAIEKVKTDKTDKPYQDVKILNVTVPKSWSSWFLWPVPSAFYTGLVIGWWSSNRTVLYFNLSIFFKKLGKGTLYQPLFHRFCMNVEIDYSSHAMQYLHSWTLSVTDSLFPLSWVVFQAQLYCLLFCFASGMYFCFWYNSFSGYNQCNALWILKGTTSVMHFEF